MRMLRPYIVLLRPPVVRAVFLASAVGRLPSGMMALALLLQVERRTGSYSAAGLAVGAYCVSVGLVSPAIGRLADRVGPRRVLLAGGIAQPLAIAVFIAVSGSTAAPWKLAACAAVTGASVPPPITTCMRALWMQLVQDSERTAAYSLETVVTEVAFIGGPLLVGASVALSSPAAALALAAALCAVGALGMASASAMRRLPRPPGACRRRAGPLEARGIRPLLMIAVGYAGALGLLEISVSARAVEAGHASAAGLLLGLLACGSMVGGAWYGGRSWRGSRWRRYGCLLGAMSLGFAPLPWAPGLVPLAVLLAASGGTIAAAGAVESELVADLAPEGTATEAFAWVNTMSFAGYAVGMLGGGALIAGDGSAATLLAAAVTAAAAATAAFVSDARLGPDPSTRAASSGP